VERVAVELAITMKIRSLRMPLLAYFDRPVICDISDISWINTPVTSRGLRQCLLKKVGSFSMGRSTSFADAGQPLSSIGVEDQVRLEEDPRWQVARRVATSKGFVRSKFLTHFLTYICEKHLLEQTGEITEQQIGEHVFRRPAGYNPGEDNIVRNYARLLRGRLEEYFAGEGKEETIRIVVPRGGYIPLFVEEGKVVGEGKLLQPTSDGPPYVEPSPLLDRLFPMKSSNRTPPARSFWTLIALCSVLFIALIFSLLHNMRSKPQQSISDRFWGVFFNAARDTLVVPADSGLAIYQDLTNTRIHLADYAGGEYQKHTSSRFDMDPALVNELGGRRYTSVVDLDLVSAISQLPAVVKNRFKVRYAREVTLDDLKQSNVILLGSSDANPWVELFQKDLNFQFEYQPKTAIVIIRNLHPIAGEKSIYETDQTDPARSTFGVIAVTSNLDRRGRVLLIEGINMAGTEAAADYLFSDASAPFLARVFDSKGNMQPFEVLVETSNIGANAPRPQIISQRIGQRQSIP
jgi:hypothetical protein